MRKISILIAVMLLSIQGFSQDQYKHINFILCIDQEVAVRNLRSPVLIAEQRDSVKRIIPVHNFYPGNLSVTNEDYKRLCDSNVVKVSLEFTVYHRGEVEDSSSVYQVSLGKPWLKSRFYVLNLYNTDNELYKGKIPPLKDRTYNYEYDSSEGSSMIIRK